MTPGNLSTAPGPRDSRRCHGVSAVVLWADGSPSRSSRAIDVDQCAGRLRPADSCAASRARVEPGAIGHTGGRGAQGRRLPMGSAETARRRPCSGNESPRSTRPPAVPRGTVRTTERRWHTLDHADGLQADMDDPADRREQSTRMVEPSMNRRLVHRDGREHLSAHSCARQDQRVQLLLRDA